MDSIITAIQDGGIWMAPIIIALVFAFAIVAERFVYILGAKSNQKALMAEIRSAIQGANYQKAVQLCSGSGKQALPTVLLAGLKKAHNPGKDLKDMESALEQASMEAFPKLTARMAFLPMLANVATLVGLLGTIVGLIEAFDAVASAAPDQKQVMLAKGISKAMYTTAGGLIAAIPTLIANSILTSMISGIMDSIDQSAIALLNEVRSSQSTAAK